jgi:hypothetical protein
MRSSRHAVAIVPTPSAFDTTNDAWERGDYIGAERPSSCQRPRRQKFLEPIADDRRAFETRELTGDGRAPRFSPGGRFIVYETGLETSRRTIILRNDATRALVAELRGVSATFSPLMAQVASRIPATRRSARVEALAAASLTAGTTRLAQTVTAHREHSAIVVRDLGTGREMELPAPDLLKTGLTFSADGRLLYFLGGTESEPDRTDIYVISEGAPRPAIVAPAGGLKGVPIVDSSGRVLVYVIPTVSPLRRPVVAAEDGGQTGVRTGVRHPSDPTAVAADQGDDADRPATRPCACPPVGDVRDRRPDGAQGVGCRRHRRYRATEDAGVNRAVGRNTARWSAPRADRRPKQADAEPSRCACAVAGRRRVIYQAMVRDDWELSSPTAPHARAASREINTIAHASSRTPARVMVNPAPPGFPYDWGRTEMIDRPGDGPRTDPSRLSCFSIADDRAESVGASPDEYVIDRGGRGNTGHLRGVRSGPAAQGIQSCRPRVAVALRSKPR